MVKTSHCSLTSVAAWRSNICTFSSFVYPHSLFFWLTHISTRKIPAGLEGVKMEGEKEELTFLAFKLASIYLTNFN